jgi:hypothetical protein
MSAIGKRGFRVALELGYGEVLARKLGPAYLAKFGRPIVLGPASLEKSRRRREARRTFGGASCDRLGCGRKGQVHHRLGLGVEDPNGEWNIQVLCSEHHIEEHRRIRRARRRGVRA